MKTKLPPRPTEFHHASIELEDRIDRTRFYAYRRMHGDFHAMAYLFACALKRQSALRLDGATLYLRLGCTDQGTLPYASVPHDKIRKQSVHYHIIFEHKQPIRLKVNTTLRGRTFLYDGPLAAFCVAYDAITNSRLQADVLRRERRTKRQAERRKEKAELKARMDDPDTADLRAKRRLKFEEPPDLSHRVNTKRKPK